MKGCKLDTDGDGNCPVHPGGCPAPPAYPAWCGGCDGPCVDYTHALLHAQPRKAKRPGWDEYFMLVARVVALRASCDRKQVGAVLVRDHRILTTGYNGAPSGLPSCEEAGHELMEINGRMSCVRTVHAEANAIFQCAKHGISLDVPGTSCYVTALPCYNCFIALVQSGVKHIVYAERYLSARSGSIDVADLAKRNGILMQWIDLKGSLWTVPDEIPG